MTEAREQPGPVPCWHHAPGRICAGHWGWAVHPTGWQYPVVLQSSPQSLGQVLEGPWVGKAQSHWRASPGLSTIPKVWFADCAGSSPLVRLCPGHAARPGAKQSGTTVRRSMGKSYGVREGQKEGRRRLPGTASHLPSL